ncbi:unnamed protein product [Amaranthus hypochondriacus]
MIVLKLGHSLLQARGK